ncbi:hypothetical protein ACFLY9_01155 [Patescibacteria group bacterium]
MSLTVKDIKIIADLLEKNNDKLATKEDLNNLRVELKGDIVENRSEIKDLREAIIILDTRIKSLEDNTVKYSDIADLFESFEEKIKKDLLVLITHNQKEIKVIKAYLNLP